MEPGGKGQVEILKTTSPSPSPRVNKKQYHFPGSTADIRAAIKISLVQGW